MADVLHKNLSGADLHECKGADTASLGQVPVATGLGNTVFTNLEYAYVNGLPIISKPYFNGGAVTGAPKTLNYIITASSGAWSQAVIGISTLHGVQVTVVSGTAGASSAYVATVNTATTATITGQVVKVDGTALGTTQTVYLTVYGV